MNFKTYYRENFHEKNIKLPENKFWYVYQTTEFGCSSILQPIHSMNYNHGERSEIKIHNDKQNSIIKY